MKSKINAILAEIDRKKQELKEEYIRLMDKYGFTIKGGKIVFNTEAIRENKKQKRSILDTIFSAQIREILSMPFIYAMIFPALFLDLMLFIFQQTAFRLYKIPIVNRSEYIVFDRKELDYLNFIQKLNCLYCSYVNGLFSYTVEVGGRTERYWCPIKHARKYPGGHKWEKKFSDFGDAKGFKKDFFDRVGKIESYNKK